MEKKSIVEYRENRLNELNITENNGYPHEFKITSNLKEYIDKYNYLPNGEESNNLESISGRITVIQYFGKSLFFAFIEQDNYQIQVFGNLKRYESENKFNDIKSKLRRGDYIGVSGYPIRCKPKKRDDGELSIIPFTITILAPCLYVIDKDTLGSSHFTDDNLRFSQRYLDFIIHPEKRNIFKIRSKIIKFIRDYFDDLDFLEVETPILSTKCGGANAKPFMTYHNDIKQNMYMRIAPELYLKQLVIGGFDKVYEIGKQFRNESIDQSHNTEFTSIEVYQSFADYNTMMDLTENLLSSLVKSLFESYNINFNDKIINFTPPFNKIDVISGLEQYGNIIFPDTVKNNFSSEETRNFLIKICNEKNIHCDEPKTISRLFDKLIGAYLEPLCINPTFIINHPQVMSPLAKYNRNNNQLTERFELFILGREYANSYTELNNPIVQKQCFDKQNGDKQLGDSEAHSPDNDFVVALEYGLPPTAGLGIGIDRLVMLLTNQTFIKEVITFRSY